MGASGPTYIGVGFNFGGLAICRRLGSRTSQCAIDKHSTCLSCMWGFYQIGRTEIRIRLIENHREAALRVSLFSQYEEHPRG